MPATDRYQILVESQTRGEADIRRFNDVMASLASAVERSNDRSARSSENASRRVKAAFDDQVRSARGVGEAVRTGIQDPVGAATGALLDGAAGLGKYASAAAGLVLGVGAVSAGLVSLVRDSTDAAREVAALAASTGLTRSEADLMRATLKLSGFEASNFTEAALDLAVALRDTSGAGAESRKMLRELGVQLVDTRGAARNVNDVLLESLSALSKISDTTRRVSLSRVLGGEDAAKNIQGLLTGIDQAQAKARALGFGTRDALVGSLSDANKEVRALDLQFEQLKAKLAGGLVVPLRFVSENFDALTFFSTPARAAQLFDQFNKPSDRRVPTGQEFKPRSAVTPFEAQSGTVIDFLRKIPSADAIRGQQLSDAFRAGRGGSEASIRFRLDALAADQKRIEAQLAADLSPAARAKIQGELRRVTAEQEAMNRQMDLLDKARAASGYQFQYTPSEGRIIGGLRAPSLRGTSAPVEPVAAGGVFVVDSTRSGGAFQVGLPSGGRTGTRGLSLGAETTSDRFDIANQEAVQRQREQAVTAARQIAEFEERRIELLTGPGGERAAIEAITALRLSALETERELNGDIADYRERRLAIEEDRTLRLLDLERRRRDEARGLASDLVGAAQDKNLGGFFRDQGRRLVNQVGTNALAPLFERTLGTLGGVGAASGLGGLLTGTILDPQNAGGPTEKNTTATERNTAAVERLTTVASGGTVTAGGGGGILGGILGSPGGGFISDANGITGRGPLVAGGVRSRFGGGLSSVQGGLFRGLFGDFSVSTGDGSATAAGTAGRIGNVVGSAAALGLAGLSAYSGFSRGGVGGVTQGIGSVLGAAALIPGPQQPFILAGAALAGVIGSLLPDPKKVRDAALDRLVNDARYVEPDSIGYAVDTAGRGFDYGRGGEIRPIVVNVSTMDAKSFVDNREMLADAVRIASMEGHGINRTMREAVLGV